MPHIDVESFINSVFNNPSLPSIKEGELIPYNPIYIQSVEHAEELEVHACGNFPDKLFSDRAPNEHPDEFAYRQTAYQPYTMPFWGRAMTAIQKKWNKANYTVKWNMDEVQFTNDNGLSEQIYFEEKYPKFKSVYSFHQTMVDFWRTKDPNAVIACYPPTLPTKANEAGEQVADRQALLEPEAIIFPSIDVIEFTKDYALLQTDEVRFFKDDSTAYHVFVLIDNEFVHRILEKPSKKGVRQFDIEEQWFEHHFEAIPAWKLGGHPEKVEDRILFKSEFNAALPHLNIALWNQSTLQASMTRAAFPQAWHVKNDCNVERCDAGWIYHGEDTKPTACQNCNGSGNNPFSPLKDFVVDWSKFQAGNNSLPMPPFGWKSPDTSILELQVDHIRELSVFAFTFINIDVSSSQPKGSDTALKAKIDQNEQYAFLLGDMHMAFDIMENCINAQGIQRYGDKWVSPDIKRPEDFTQRTVEELTLEMFSYWDKKMPSILKGAALFSFFESRFGPQAHLRNVLKVLLNSDVFITFPELEFNAAIGNDRVPKWMSVLHDNGMYLAQVAMDQNPDLLTKTVEDQRIIMKALADAYLLENYPTPVTSTQSILDLANLS